MPISDKRWLKLAASPAVSLAALLASMPMRGSQPSKISKDLGNIEAQLRSGKTRGSNPRGLEPEESAGGAPQSGFAALEQKRDAMRARMRASAKERTVARLNAHATAEADRVAN